MRGEEKSNEEVKFTLFQSLITISHKVNRLEQDQMITFCLRLIKSPVGTSYLPFPTLYENIAVERGTEIRVLVPFSVSPHDTLDLFWVGS